MAIKDYTFGSQGVKAPEPTDMLKGLDDAALMQLRSAIDKELNIDPRNLNMAEELGFQYRAGKALLADIQDDDRTPANQRAQVFNSVAAMLAQITKTQEAIYSVERLKKIEIAVLQALKSLPAEAKHAFFDLYGEYLGAENLPEPLPNA